MRWPVREACLAYEAKLREEAGREYSDAMLRYTVAAQWSKDPKPPKLPVILRPH